MKLGMIEVESSYKWVAPRVGAWVEIFHLLGQFQNLAVAPRVGAWVEIGVPLPVTP